jgi:hypothetical protein
MPLCIAYRFKHNLCLNQSERERMRKPRLATHYQHSWVELQK